MEGNDLKKRGEKNIDELKAYFAQVKICTAEELGEGLSHDDLQLGNNF